MITVRLVIKSDPESGETTMRTDIQGIVENNVQAALLLALGAFLEEIVPKVVGTPQISGIEICEEHGEPVPINAEAVPICQVCFGKGYSEQFIPGTETTTHVPCPHCHKSP